MKIRERFIYWLARKLLPTLDGHVIVFNKGKAFIDGQELNATEVNSMCSEAHLIEQTRLWQLMNGNLVSTTRKKLYEEATDITQILFAKTILYTLDIQKQILDKCKTLKD